MKLDTQAYEKLIADVEKEFSDFLAKSESEAKPTETLAKSEDEKSEDKKDEEKAEEKKDEEPKQEAEAPKAEEEKKDEDKKDEDEAHDYDEKEVEELHKMYDSMAKGEMKLHKEAMEKCWMKKCGDMTVAKSEEQPKEEPLKKSEELAKAEQELGQTKTELEARSKELESAKEANVVLKKNVEELAIALNDFISKKGPARKAVTSLEFVKKSEEAEKTLSKSEVHTILTKKSQDPKLEAKDREAINNYYLRGQNLEVVKHLLR